MWFLYRNWLKIPVDEGLGRIRDMETPLWTNCLFSAAPGIVKRVYIKYIYIQDKCYNLPAARCVHAMLMRCTFTYECSI